MKINMMRLLLKDVGGDCEDDDDNENNIADNLR